MGNQHTLQEGPTFTVSSESSERDSPIPQKVRFDFLSLLYIGLIFAEPFCDVFRSG